MARLALARRGMAWYGKAKQGKINLKGKIMVKKKTHKNDGDLTAIYPVTNDAESDINTYRPYAVQVTVQGTCPILLHRFSPEAVEEKANAPKNSVLKKTDNLESYVYRTNDGEIGIPGEYICRSAQGAAKSQQDPRSPRKSAADLFKAGLISLTDPAPILPQGRDSGVTEWEYVDRRGAPVQRNRIIRERPAFNAGWRATWLLQVLSPEYISSDFLLAVLVDAGRFQGLADYRPTFGRFNIIQYEVLDDDTLAKIQNQ